MKVTLLLFIFIALIFFVWKNVSVPKTVGVVNGKLAPCPRTPNCVSSEAKDKPYAIEAISYSSGNVLDSIESYLLTHYDAKVMTKTTDYLHVVVTTPYFRFKDDLEFLLDLDQSQISVRSASRIGYSDLDMNRKRIEKLRQYLDQR